METLIQKSPSVGNVIKKILAINPNLTTQEVILIVRKSVRTRGAEAGDFASAEIIDEEQCIAYARSTLNLKR